MPVLGINEVIAQTTEPPQETWVPLFQTATPYPTQDLSCPVGPPVGYGQVTPNPAWNQRCEKCLPTAVPQWTPYKLAGNCSDWGNPPGGIDIVEGDRNFCEVGRAQPTPTVTPTVGPMYWISTDYTLTIENLSGGGWVAKSGVMPINKPVGQQYAGFIYRSKYTGVSSNVFADFNVNVAERISNAGPPLDETLNNWSTWRCIGTNTSVCPAVGQSHHATAIFYQDGKNFGFTLNKYNPSDSRLYIELKVIYFGVPYYLVPTPNTNYCGTINSYNPNDRDTQLPIFRVGNASSLTMGGFDIDLSWVSQLGQLAGLNIPSTISVPQIVVNLRPIEFGILEILGVDINLDLMAFVMGALLGLRIFVRS